ncbi:hypothetical protein DL98DRAFT_519820 [Cadophora sp. DSE1049]|nr:hypothetical protein DL98DRAFT_519820 [Cadophora sp. DSE1049]
MTKPSLIARKARREHERQQAILQKRNLPLCPGCELCSATKARECQRLQQQHEKSLRSRTRQALKNTLFEGVVVIKPKDVALTGAASEAHTQTDQSRQVYWTDGSCRHNSSCGLGVVYYCSIRSRWIELSWRVRGFVGTHVLEIYAISKALEIAWNRCRDMETKLRPTCICVYSDCTGALEYFDGFRWTLDGMKRLPCGPRLVGPGIVATKELSAVGIKVELRYVPGHAGIEGNVKADRAAKKGAEHFAKQRVAGVMIELLGGGGHDL